MMKKTPKSDDEVVPVRSLSEEDLKGHEGQYVKAPEYNVPIFVPEIDPDGTIIFPDNFFAEDDWENYITDPRP